MANQRHFYIEQLDQEKFIKENNLQEIRNPVMFNASNDGPTPDGLLSNEIFGITQAERAGIFAYIDLKEYFIQPYYYKIWLKIDKNLRACIYETQNFKIDSSGNLIPSDDGETGIEFIRKNIDKINFKKSKKDLLLNALNDAKKKKILFTKKIIVIPPYYRDVNTNANGSIGVGEINKLYISLLNNVKALNSSNLYGLNMAGGIRGKIQDNLMEIYNWFTLGESVIGGEHTGAGIFKKFGIQRRAVMAKTTDYSARLVISAPNTNVNTLDDLMVDLDYSSIPLSAACVIAYPFIIYQLRHYFDNIFGGKINYSYIDSKNNLQTVELDNPLIEFSDDRLDKELNEFIHGYSNRFKMIMIPNKENKKIALKFKGYYISEEEYKNGKRESNNIIERHLTWLDLLYISAVESTEDKVAIITRYPMDSYFNQLYTMIHVSSTIETEPMVINGKFYKWYPKIREEDIRTNTSNKFIDTLSMANPYCALMDADYDGDQVTVKMAYSTEANEELKKYMKSNAQFVKFNGENGRVGEQEALQVLYNLTLALPNTKLDNVEF